MRGKVNASLRDPLLVETAGAIVSVGEGPAEEAQLIREYLAEHVRFTPDPLGLELVRSPTYMVRAIQERGLITGDCDDVAALGAALGKAVGLPARWVLLAFGRSRVFRHIYTELWTPCQGWVELDTTRPGQFPPGLQVTAHETVEV